MMDNVQSLNEVLIQARKDNASDVHLSFNQPVLFRKNSKLIPVSAAPLSAEQIKTLITKELPADVISQFDTTGDAEHVHLIPDHGRFRISLMKQQDKWDFAARVVPITAPTPQDIGLPAACTALTKWAQGMVLVTGPAGSGKTTTLSCLVELINAARSEHIISIEQPIEIVYSPKKCQITQREVLKHTQSQHNALRASLREDPDILVVSELRDLQTIQLAITAAETGHLVFGTMNTVNAAQTISKLIDSFPADEQPIMRNMISESLRGVICQQLVPKKDGSGMVAAYEILIVSHSVASLIREGRILQINNAIATGKSFGMQMMDMSLQQLAQSGVISTVDACERAANPTMMLQTLGQ